MAYSNFYARFYATKEKTLAAWEAVWRLKSSRFYFLAVGLLQISAWLQAIFIYRKLSSDLLVLHYNVDFGIDLVGSPRQIFYYPLFGLGIFLLNLIIAAALKQKKDFKVIVHMLLAVSTLLNIFLCLSILSIYFINFL